VPVQALFEQFEGIVTCPSDEAMFTMLDEAKMDFIPIIPAKKTLNKAYLRKPIERTELVRFKSALNRLFDNLDESKDEEFIKGLFRTFLEEAFYRDRNAINTKDKIDLAIYGGPAPTGQPLVLFEVKRPSNVLEMFSNTNPNVKALHELILYFLRERIEGKNLEIRHVAIVNVRELFLFNARDFETNFFKNHSLVRAYEDHERGAGLAIGTGDFYSEVAKPFVQRSDSSLEYIHLSLVDLDRASRRPGFDLADLIVPYKLLSPSHLLKEPFQNDSNSLDKAFYAELLHILGLEEHRDGSKLVIRRPEAGSRISGSLLELAMEKLELSGGLDRLSERERYGSNKAEISFSVVLELVLLWVNRLLFLKLLEAQILDHHGGDQNYRFLTVESVPDFDALHELFFGVLAKRPGERNDRLALRFCKVPYLNSSLFEESELEGILSVDRLSSRLPLHVYGRTVLKDSRGERVVGQIPVLEYLLAFLDAYDFSSEGEGAAVERGKTLINASVLGLIFEKINGYKEGSFYTPGYVTQYMAKKAVEAAVLRRFSQVSGKEYSDLSSLSNELGTSSREILEANTVFDSLRIVDPAVGSGHFLVSVLNELIAIKSELGILADHHGKRLKGVRALVENDELFLVDEEDASFATYCAPFAANERQRLRETLFEEKRRLIESCLFGVDLNRNSVQICKLRLWIELLKSSFYTEESGYLELETLPNIDVNIKRGNSLVARYPLDMDLSEPLKKKGLKLETWMQAIRKYQNAETKLEKREAEKVMNEIHSVLASAAYDAAPDRRRLIPLKGELTSLEAPDLIARTEKDVKIEARKEKLRAQIASIEARIESDDNNPIFREAFEWRYEFPEVLDDDGAFVGFDVVIGNPPYIRIQELTAMNPASTAFYGEHFSTGSSGNFDIYVLFIEQALRLLATKAEASYICPNKFMLQEYGEATRRLLTSNKSLSGLVDFGDYQVFSEATIYTCILTFGKRQSKVVAYNSAAERIPTSEVSLIESELLDPEPWPMKGLALGSLFSKLVAHPRLSQFAESIFVGVQTSADKVFILEERNTNSGTSLLFSKALNREVELETRWLRPLLSGTDVKRYIQPTSKARILFPYETEGDEVKLIDQDSLRNSNPRTWEYLTLNEKLLAERENGRLPLDKWHGYIYLKNMKLQANPKICIPRLVQRIHAWFDSDGEWCLDNVDVGGMVLAPAWKGRELLFVGILNSRLLTFILRLISTPFRGDFYSCNKQYLEKLPIAINEANGETAQIETLVSTILEKKKSNPGAEVAALEAQIDSLVYGLYRLTDDEIAIIEARN
jgi:adenine-specific DNA-methyltransferase